MTARPSAGPASAYPTLSGPASTCFSAPNGVLEPGGTSVALIFGAVVIAAYRGEAATARAALRMWSVTACGFIGNLLQGANAGSRRAHRDDAGTDGMTAPHVASRARPAWVLLPGSAARLGYAHMMTAACP